MGNKFLQNIPKEIKKETNFSKFKKLLKEFLITKVIYSLYDFSTSS